MGTLSGSDSELWCEQSRGLVGSILPQDPAPIPGMQTRPQPRFEVFFTEFHVSLQLPARMSWR